MTAEGQKRLAEVIEARKRMYVPTDPAYYSVKTRCIIHGNAPPPMLPNNELSTYQIIQSPGYVTIHVERLHDARIIPLDGRPFPSQNVRQYMGVSRGRWEGNTLVVESRNFNSKRPGVGDETTDGGWGPGFRGASEDMRVTERFTRVSANRIDYRFTVEDPKTWARPWTAEVPFERLEPQGPFFEYACHESNYGLALILSAARYQEKMAAEEAAKKKGSK